jgi:hypothetical protein
MLPAGWTSVGTVSIERTPAEVVILKMFEAHAAGRLDACLACLDPGVVWHPKTQPSRPFYLGREGSLALMADMAAVYGDFRVDCERFTDLGQDRTLVEGKVVIRSAAGEDADHAFRTVITVRRDRVARVDQVDDDTEAWLVDQARAD